MSRLSGITLSLNSGQLSDLFFNFEHPERDKLYQENNNTEKDFSDEDELKAVTEDAKEFCSIIGYGDDIEMHKALAEDFMERV